MPSEQQPSGRAPTRTGHCVSAVRSGASNRSQSRQILRAILVSTTGVLPTFLVGALAVQVRESFYLGASQMGLAAALFFAASGALSRPMGMLIQRIGGGRGFTLSALLSATALAGIASAPDFAVLLIWMAVAGMGNACASPAANLGISEAIGPRMLGLALGIKQSAIPLATLGGGLAVPMIALTWGWRWAIALGALAALALAVWGASSGLRRQAVIPVVHESRALIPRSSLLVLTIGAGLATAGSTCIGIFLVVAAADTGIAPAAAGLLFAFCSVLGVGGRIGFGRMIDLHPGWPVYAIIAGLLVSGAAGYLLLGSGNAVAFICGAILAFVGWTWAGLFQYGILRESLNSAAAATGFISTGIHLGGAVGPLAFGFIVTALSFQAAWTWAALLGVSSAVMMLVGRRMARK